MISGVIARGSKVRQAVVLIRSCALAPLFLALACSAGRIAPQSGSPFADAGANKTGTSEGGSGGVAPHPSGGGGASGVADAGIAPRSDADVSGSGGEGGGGAAGAADAGTTAPSGAGADAR